ncbi:MAG: hypothetical protein HN337_06730 [Deltaproteobacteria bacterium]|jgi:hypothetical protein|nr:hypothetical protein [Deltaproteobacteria bacterium]
MLKKLSLVVVVVFLVPVICYAKKSEPQLSMEIIKAKSKGSWTEVFFAIKNDGIKSSDVNCCKAYLEDMDGFAIANLNRGELRSLIHNKARTAAIVGAIAGLGMGIGGAAGGVDELAYAGLATAGASGIAGAAGAAAADAQRRSVIIDDIMRNRTFPAGLKVAGAVYFPPKKKWPSSKVAKALHITYEVKGKEYTISAPITDEDFKKNPGSKPKRRHKWN